MKYLTKATILKIKEYEKDGPVFAHFLSDKYLSILAPDATLPVSPFAIFHEQTTGPFADVMRVVIAVPKDRKSGKTEQATIDMSVEDYHALPETDDR